MVNNEMNSQKENELGHITETSLIGTIGEVVTIKSHNFSLVIGTSVNEQTDFLPDDYPESLESETSDYDAWLG